MRRLARAVAVLGALAVALAVAVVAVKASDGAFSGQYQLSGLFSRSGEGLHPGSEVTYAGVQVGRVTSITLAPGGARVDLALDPGFAVPDDATATVRPINVFGADEVTFTFPSGDRSPHLRAGATLAHTAVSDELGDLFAAADPLLARIDTGDLSTVVSTLAQAAQGEGPTIAGSIDEGAKLAAFLDETLPAQLAALDSFAGFTQTVAPVGGSLNAIAAASNRALPTFNANAAAYDALVRDLTPFADDLSQLLSAYHPDFVTLLTSGDDVARVLLVRQSDIGNLVTGLGIYLEKFASASDSTELLPDGSQFAYFHTFIEFSDLNALVCGLIAPPVPGLSALEPLQQALTGAGSPLDCSSQLTAFDAAQAQPPPAASPSSAAASAAAQRATSQAASALDTQAYEALTAPTPAPGSGSSSGGALTQILQGLLG